VKEKEVNITKVPVPRTDVHDELKRIVRTQLLATDPRVLVIHPLQRGVRTWRWRTEVIKKYMDEENQEKIVGLIAHQLLLSKRAFIIATSS